MLETQRRFGKRAEFSYATKRIIRTIVESDPFCGRCPCCFARDVLSEGETAPRACFDHFYGPAFNRPEFAWLVCGPCHKDLTRSTVWRANAIPKFHNFQAHVTDFLFHGRYMVE